MKKTVHSIATIVIILLHYTFSFSQINIDINSGNPSFPFPQFLKYESTDHSLENLASTNAPGVTHAEMEQQIRDAWKIMSNRFVYTGTSYAGVRFIKANNGCPYDCSEGDGYALLAAAEMADKTTFDGIWFRTHDVRMVKQPRYADCVVPDPGYRYGRYALKDNTDSAADGDFDIALALLVAYKQWGEDSGYRDACGDMISYKVEALKVIRGLVERSDGDVVNNDFTSGSIKYDGYIKGGNTWNQLTNLLPAGSTDVPQFGGSTQQHIDYAAPAYFHAFAKFLEDEGDANDRTWNINQFKRGEASSDWLMGKMITDSPSTLPLAGWVSLDAANKPTYSNFTDGEDFRNPWRTILNYVWHGDPKTTWNPNTVQVETGSNSFEQEIGKRLAQFLKNPGKAPWSNPCNSVGGGPALTFNGPSQIKQYYNPITGTEQSTFPLNWLSGTGSPAAVAAQDLDLMGKLYRQCVIEWDVTDSGDGYLTSVPGYFHGFFRLLGMLTLSGNHHSPAETKLESNLKVYHKVDKTFAFSGDELEYTISYRNYASVDATGVSISTKLPVGLTFISATNGGVSLGDTVTWNLGTVDGFKTASGITPTMGEITLKVKIEDSAPDRLCNEFEIKTDNGKGWISNEYPNEITAIMQRNCIDIAKRALEIEKTANFTEVNPGDEVTYTIDFENASSGGFLNGGRQGVNIAYAHGGHAASSSEKTVHIRLYHGADEPYIDYGNYRISMFLNDNAVTCVTGEPGCTGTGWVLDNQIYEGGDKNNVSITSEPIIPGSDARGAWNQRVIVKFSEQLATITPHVSRYFGLTGRRIHQGGGHPLRAVWQMHTNIWSSVKWDDDWSWNPAANDSKDGLFYPITNNWTDPDNPDIPVTEYHNEACQNPTTTVDNILVEEWDGFTWRRVFGNSPAPGREVENVILKDILPLGFAFVGFVDDIGTNLGNSVTVLGETATYDVATRTITWVKPKMQVKEKGTIKYKAIANFSRRGTCPRADELQTNTASIEAKNESPTIAEASVNVTCTPVILPRPPSSMSKIATPKTGVVGDEITYTLAYENTDGSPFNADFTRPWTTRLGNPMNVIANDGISSVPNNSGVSTHNFSHGTNGEIEARVNFTGSAAFGFALRYAGATTTSIAGGIYIVFKPNFGSGNIETKVYDGTTQIDATTLTAPANPPKIKLRLADDQLQVWIGNTTNPTPTWVATGLPIRAGYAGIINGFPDGSSTHGIHKVIQFKSSLDSAFDLQITDPIPNEVSFVMADNGGVNTSGIVTYPKLVGPVLAGTTVSYTWKAEINSCPTTTSKIINIGYTNALGLPINFIQAQAIVDCSGIDVCSGVIVPPPTISTVPNFCVGHTPTDIAIYVTATETLVWYADAVSTTPITKPTINTTIASSNTYYASQKTTADCESTREIITITVGESEPAVTDIITIESGQAINYDIITKMGLLSNSVNWSATTNTSIVGESLIPINTNTITDVLTNNSPIVERVIYTITENNPSFPCGRKNSTLTVSITPKPSLRISATDAEEGNDLSITLTLSKPATTIVTANVSFTPNTADATDLSLITETVSFAPGEITKSFNRATIDDILIETDELVDISISNVVTANATIFSANTTGTIKDNDRCGVTSPITTDSEFCLGEIAPDISSLVSATETIIWYPDLISTTAISKPIINTAIAIENTYYVSQKNSITNCESSRAPLKIKIIAPKTASTPQLTINNNTSPNYNIETELGLISGRYSWEASVNNNIVGETTSPLNTPIINDLLENTTTIEQIVTYTITETSSTKCPNPPTILTVKIAPTIITPSKTIVNISSVTVEEGNDLVVTINLSKPLSVVSTFEISFTEITATIQDLDLATETVTLLPGETTKRLRRPTIDDVLVENTETLRVHITNNNVASLISINNVDAIATITDNDILPCVLEVPKVVDPEICLNEPLNLTDFITTTHTLVWYENATISSPISKPTLNTGVVQENIFYVSQKNATCESNRVPIKITIKNIEDGLSDFIEIKNGTAVNYNIFTTMGLATNKISWHANTHQSITGQSISNISSDKITDTLTNTTKNAQTITYQISEIPKDNLCPRSTSILEVTVLPKVEEIEYPLFFTPNNDSKNDYWKVKISNNSSIKIVEIKIFDRYGKILAIMDNNNQGWDGTLENNLLPSDDYWYVIDFEQNPQKLGHFSLVR